MVASNYNSVETFLCPLIQNGCILLKGPMISPTELKVSDTESKYCVCVLGKGGAEWVVRHNSERKSLPATSTYYGLHVCLPPEFIYVESLTTSGMIFGGRAFGR